MKRPTIKQLQDLAFELHCEAIEHCLNAHQIRDSAKSGNSSYERGLADAKKLASKRIRVMIEEATE